MDHPTSTPLMSRFDGYSTRALLEAVTGSLKVQKTAKIDEWCAIVAWADTHTIDTLEGAATVTDGWLDTGVPVAGPGAPLVSEFALMELVAVLGRSPEGGRVYVGQVIELAWRLQRVFAAVLTGRCEPWKAQRVADLTHALSEAAFDLHLRLVPGAHFDAALDVFDLDPAARVQRTRLVDRRGGEGAVRRQQGQAECEALDVGAGHGRSPGIRLRFLGGESGQRHLDGTGHA